MGAKTDLFPTFSELCAIAREVEKKPLSVPPRPIDGKLVLDENFGIFPREFEEYTYSFLLFEAQKIERRLSADAIASTQQSSMISARRLTPEQQMENDLHKFVSTHEQSSSDDEESPLQKTLRERKAPAPTAPAEVADYERENPTPRVSYDPDAAPIPGEDAEPVPEVPALPPAKRVELPSLPPAKPRVLPPKVPLGYEQKKTSQPSGAPPIPPAKPTGQAAPKIPPTNPPEQDAFEPSEPAAPYSMPSKAQEPSTAAEAEAEKKPPAGISSYSKLSPRLRAIIEQKLHREEEKAKKAREDADIFKTPPPAPPEEESGEDNPGKELENVDAPNAWNLHDEEAESKGADDALRARDKGKKMPPPASAWDEREETIPGAPPEDEMGESPRKLPLRKMEADEIAPMPDDEAQTGDAKTPAPRKLASRLPQVASPLTASQKGAPFSQSEKVRRQLRPPAKSDDAREEESEDVSEQLQPSAKAGDEEEAPALDDEGQIPPEPLATRLFARKEKIKIAKSAIPDDAPSEEDEKEKQTLPARREPQAGPFMIKPLFPDADASGSPKEKQEISQAEDSDRMRRIQRIIEDLSPDKMRAQPRQEEVSPEKEEEEKEPEEEAQAPEADEPAPRKTAAGKKSKAPIAPLKKLTSAQKKKAAAAQEEEARTEVLRRKTAPIGAEGSNREARQKTAPMKKLQRQAPAEELPEEEAEEIPIPKKAGPKLLLRQKEAAAAKEEAQAPRKIAPRIAMHEEETESPEEEEKPLPASRKLAPRLPPREEESEDDSEQLRSPAKADEEEEEQAPARPFRKLMPRLPPREEPEEETPEEVQAQPARGLPMRRRILPGMGRTAPSTPQTYVPPARERKQIAPPTEAPEEEAAQEPPAEEEAEISPRIAPIKPRKLVSDEAPLAVDKTPEQLLQDQKMAKMAEQLARLEAGKVKEVAGTAAMPVEQEDIPLPGDDEGVPKPEEYEQAKESLRKSLEREETVRKVRQEDEVTVEQYAKDHLVWLYEIYKMGGMGREDFLQKASEKYSEAQNAGAAAVADKAPPNPALANLGKEIEKKDKK